MRNKGTLWAGLVILAVVCISVIALQHSAPSRPTGVTADQWKALTPECGIVISKDSAGNLRGTLMAYTVGEWRKVLIQSQPIGPLAEPLSTVK